LFERFATYNDWNLQSLAVNCGKAGAKNYKAVFWVFNFLSPKFHTKKRERKTLMKLTAGI